MPDEIDPDTQAMLAGAEVEHGSGEDDGATHHPRTEPVEPKPLLTTDPEAQKDDSVIEPEST